MTINSVFNKLGLSVISTDRGIYHLRRGEGQAGPIGEVVGLLYSAEPLTPDINSITVFLQEVVEGTPAARIMYHWQTLDARRFEESGLDPIELTLDAEHIPAVFLEQRFMRPDGVRVRHGVKLATGDVVCYN